MANLINVLDPDVVVLGGGVSKFDALYSVGVTEVARRVFSDSLETPIVKHQLNDSQAACLGVAGLGTRRNAAAGSLGAALGADR